ncbi:phosphotransferase family protein [Devosia sediminis]|uniref:Aminoglycoside phosphotransferase family protein n=1 Tax=Devosia sediminis TaxID=2798801 RepID=A0A934IWA0_9HYPH|nr:aminoglycoside phosphotransferase family protein [Devosia sediminis]MBJ3784271.1 aminoglycoside phosphotransferase family protein [Devosia sediminis]
MSGPKSTATPAIPTEATVLAIVRERFGWNTAEARRFTTGMAFYVYDVLHGPDNVVVRIGLPNQAGSMAEGLALWRRLTPLGVPLPAILADGTDADLPYVIMTRLEGTDLGHVMMSLTAPQRTAIAQSVADAQLATARLGPGQTFGFAARPEAAPHRTWGDVIAAGIDRSTRRIAANGLFPPSIAAPVIARFEHHRPALDAIAATPFLHDTTTKNVIVADTGRFSGIVDVDDLCFGDPRYAAALTRAALLAFGGPADYIEPWLARMHLPQDGVFSFYVAEFLLNFMSEHGMVFNGNSAPSDPATRNRLAALLTRVLDAAP